MKIADSVERLVNLHKKCCKSGVSSVFNLGNDMQLAVQKDYISLSINVKSVFIISISKNNGDTLRGNNSQEIPGHDMNYLFKVTYNQEFVVNTGVRTETYPIPRFNDNDDELYFMLSTVMMNAISVVMSSVFLTMDTYLNTIYTCSFDESMFSILQEGITKAEQWYAGK